MSGILVHARAAGRPRTKGSLKATCDRTRSHNIRIQEEVTESKSWRAKVALELRHAQIAEHGKLISWPGPVEVRLVFFLPRTEAVAGGPIPTHATEWPIHKSIGDADKMERNILDALSTPKRRSEMPYCSALLADDSQVVDLWGAKFWVSSDRGPEVQILVMEAETPEEHLIKAEKLMGGWLR